MRPGVVIGDRPLAELVPLYRDPRSDMPVTQFNMKWVELAGLVKFDFLGLKTLTVLARCTRAAARRAASSSISPTCRSTTRRPTSLLARGDTVGVFQVEGAGMRDMLQQAAARPVRGHHRGRRALPAGADGEHPALHRGQARRRSSPTTCTRRSRGSSRKPTAIMIYQEQVMQIAQVLAGYTLGGADLLRRAMGKKIQAEMDAQRQLFVEGAAGARGRAARAPS